MIKPITPITLIDKVYKYFLKKPITCAWCFKSERVFPHEQNHICSHCGKTFFITGNLDLKI